ncbi:YbjQ family protein, partial [Dehalococcoidia bacterium]|nr:YbjQ family protein [Dehalococcoidia bacterium]
MAQSREEAMQRMVEQAKKMGANAILGTRFMTSMVAAGAAEFLAYGTAVVVE